jgi:anthranilate synthase component 1
MFQHTNLSQSEFLALAEQGYTHVPIVQEILADLDTPVSTFLKLANHPYSYVFESVQGGDKWGRYSIIGLPCEKVFEFRGNTFSIRQDGKITSSETVDNPLEKVREIQSQYSVFERDDLPPMHGGLVGHFGYETIQYIEKRLQPESQDENESVGGSNGRNHADPIEAPDILLMESKNVLVFDNVSGRISLITLAATAEKEALTKAEAFLSQLSSDLRKKVADTKTLTASQHSLEKETENYTVHFPQADFEQAVEKCRQYIREGDIMQVVLSQRLSTDFKAKPFDLYRALRTINPSPYMYFLDLGDYQIVGSSPEILVSLQRDEQANKQSKNKVTVRPIAGTRKRGVNEADDVRLENELLADPKELAEHLMLIDLGRNDVGRIAKTGSVELTEKMIIERYSHVMHIVSNVDGELIDDMDAMDVLAATFPAGTVSGAPKIRAMEIIAELEPYKRGIYSGAVGYIGWQGNMDTAIAIRTAVIKGGHLYLQAGAGIVADSVPKYEWKETMNKARAMMVAVNMVDSE